MRELVTTRWGQVQGQEKESVYSWLGMPYAAPPWGERRFARPYPPDRWDGVRNASGFGPASPQVIQLPGGDLPDGGEEPDCLTINVWAPADVEGPLPVMVWIYGGAFLAGSAAEAAYDGSALARLGVVVVTFNYRLGVDGFGELEGAVANRGLLDQVAALEWVRDNISAFNGDASRVTIFGESAGAGCILALLTMPCARGLFHRAIMQSVPNLFFSRALSRSITESIAAAAGIAQDDIGAFKALSLDALIKATLQVRADMGSRLDWGRVAQSVTPIGPVVDGEILPEDPWTALRRGASREVPFIIGHNRDEYRVFLAQPGKPCQVTNEQLEKALETFAPNGDVGAYHSALPGEDAASLYEKVQGDWLFLSAVTQAAQAQLEAGGTVFMYEFCIEAPGGMGSPHAIDLPFTFDTFGVGMGAMIPYPTEAERQTGERLRRAWVRFASGDDPWPQWGDKQQVQIWGEGDEVRAYPESRRMELWRHEPCTALFKRTVNG
ncbi:carboxylesterase family protein [Pseudomonas sp.]|uniref:carboxylesterase/lipase family protein n=1 Tax=Pseudomonas sp. TaxID=306 RepID=UPI0028AD3664|nr:carboxylesterase family protein [Pseudomonas sp.]